MKKKVLLVDLNNFARYPSIAIGYVKGILDAGGFEVDVLAPLSTGISGVVREPHPPWWGRFHQEFRYRTTVTRNRLIRWMRNRFGPKHASELSRERDAIVSEFERCLDNNYDVVLISAYLMYQPHCESIGVICRDRNVPLIIGGPYFAVEDVAREWINITGLKALVGGEVEENLSEIVERVIVGKPVDHMQGIWRNDGALVLEAPPAENLDAIPFPDYSDFPWAKYPNKIIPITTGRGCAWGVCTFCSDVVSTAGRTFRTRSPENVFAEIAQQHEKYGARLFVFTDLKLNSSLEMWRGILGRMQEIVPGARWIGGIHVGIHGENGLSLGELKQAREAGMVRVTTGFESGSQRVLDSMVKGTNLSATSRFLRYAKEADISVRASMVIGYPGETTDDVEATVDFLKRHDNCLERIQLNRFQIVSGTRIAQLLEQKPQKYSTITDLDINHQIAQICYQYKGDQDPGYVRAVSQLIGVVHRINRRPLSAAARDFDGVM